MHTTRTESDGVLALGGALDISAASDLRNLLADSWQREAALTLDLSEAETCDTAGLQLLCSVHKSATPGGRRLRVIAVSEAIAAVSAAIGLSLENLGVQAQRAPMTADSSQLTRGDERAE